MMRTAALGVLLLLCASCSDETRCSANADCPVQSYCQIDEGALSGACGQDCTATVECPAGLRCTALGRCSLLDLSDADGGVGDGGDDDGGVGDGGEDVSPALEDGPLDAPTEGGAPA